MVPSAPRLTGFLQAAGELFAEVGYEAVTVQAIVDRSRSPIGAVYNFPDKESVAATPRRKYSEELNAAPEITEGAVRKAICC